MFTTPTPQASHPHAPASAVQWFAQSKRLIGGKPDARYGWLPTGQGPCIVKALESTLTAYASTLLQHERTMLLRLAELNAPVPTLVASEHPDWIVTRFAGLSLQHLQGNPNVGTTQTLLSFAEAMSVWVHLLRRLQPMARAGVIAMDLYEANVVVPLTGGSSGQLRLNAPVLIDHAHTLEAGMRMRRPVWLALDMEHIAPELRDAVVGDQAKLRETFRQMDADLPGYSRMPTERDTHNRKVWAEYDAPQLLQSLLDQGQLSADHAMQFAIGTALARLLKTSPATERPAALQDIVAHMVHADPAQRFVSMLHAADALQAQFAALPLVSHVRLDNIGPDALAGKPTASGTQPTTQTATPMGNGPAASEHTAYADAVPGLVPNSIARPTLGFALGTSAHLAPPEHSSLWQTLLFAALAVGAAIGVAWPL